MLNDDLDNVQSVCGPLESRLNAEDPPMIRKETEVAIVT